MALQNLKIRKKRRFSPGVLRLKRAVKNRLADGIVNTGDYKALGFERVLGAAHNRGRVNLRKCEGREIRKKNFLHFTEMMIGKARKSYERVCFMRYVEYC